MNGTFSPKSWKRLGRVSPGELTDARQQLHQAAQIVAAVGISYLEPRKDYGHGSFIWLENLEAFAIEEVKAEGRYQFGLHPGNFVLLVIQGGRTTARFPLDHRTQMEAIEWLKQQLSASGLEPHRFTMEKKYTIPTYPQSENEPFLARNRDAFAELAAYFANAHAMLQAVAETFTGISEIRCWPHHFDLAATIPFPAKKSNSEEVPMIALGLSPGDEFYGEPYFYIYPWPYPDLDDISLPELPEGGLWHREKWFGSVLPAMRIIAQPASEGQIATCVNFFQEAINISRSLLNLGT